MLRYLDQFPQCLPGEERKGEVYEYTMSIPVFMNATTSALLSYINTILIFFEKHSQHSTKIYIV